MEVGLEEDASRSLVLLRRSNSSVWSRRGGWTIFPLSYCIARGLESRGGWVVWSRSDGTGVTLETPSLFQPLWTQIHLHRVYPYTVPVFPSSTDRRGGRRLSDSKIRAVTVDDRHTG